MLTKRALIVQMASVPALSVAAKTLPTNLIVRHDRLFLDVRVNAHPVRALLDSAAETSMLDVRFARRLGLTGGQAVRARGSGGDTQAAMADGVRIEALGFALGPLTVAVIDLSDVGRRLLQGPLDCIMGRELFDAARLSIDINAGRMGRAAGAHPPGVLLPLATEKGIETFPVSVEGHDPAPAAFDLGNGGSVLIGAAYARKLGLLTDGRPVRMQTGGGIGGSRPRQTIRLRSLAIAGRTFKDVPAAVDDTGSATSLNIGVPILRQFRIVTDFPAHRLWLG